MAKTKKPSLEELAEIAELETLLNGLRDSNARLSRQLLQEKIRTGELVNAVYRAAKDAASGLRLPAIPAPKTHKSKQAAEVAIAVLSDWQLAKITPSYSSVICEKRIEEYAEKVIRLTEVQRHDHPVTELRVYMLGDIVEGELIFPGQSHLIDASLYRQVMVDGPRILTTFLRKMLGTFSKVSVVGVIGNHGSLGGRARKDYHPESNADAMMYEASRLMLDNQPRLHWDPNFVAGERKWYALDIIGNKKFFLFHGDQILGGFAGFPWYGFDRKLKGWDRIYGFDYSLSGHFHTPVRMLSGDIVHWGSGSTESDNTYAAERLSAQGRPSQWLLFCHPENGVTAEYEVQLS